jgi:putative transcriptional regulator
MSHHPAPDELLLDYATGALPEGPALAVSLHVALDPAARRTVDRLRALGGAFLEAEAAAPEFEEGVLAGVMARLDGTPVESKAPTPRPRADIEWAPAPL